MCDVQGAVSAQVMGGITFAYIMADGSRREWEVDIDLYCGNYSTTGSNSGRLNPGTHFILFNPTLGVAKLYNESFDKNPFYLPDMPLARDFTLGLVSEIDSTLTPIDTFYVEEVAYKAITPE
jgi:hypothetical protein